jgi:hypothetical protein
MNRNNRQTRTAARTVVAPSDWTAEEEEQKLQERTKKTTKKKGKLKEIKLRRDRRRPEGQKKK